MMGVLTINSSPPPMRIDYRKPIPIEQPVELRARAEVIAVLVAVRTQPKSPYPQATQETV